MPRKTNQGFINIIGLVAIAAFGVASLALYQVRGIIEKEIEKQVNLGAANTELSDTIGTFRTNVNTLNHQVIDSTSTDPGHVHTLTSSSGTLSIAKGGTGTSTLPTTDGQLPIISASTTSYTYTNAIPNCNTTSTDKLLYTSSTKLWSCSSDQNVAATITATGTLVLVSSSTMGTTSSSLNSAPFNPSNFKNFRFVAFIGQHTGTNSYLVFNASSATSQEYGNRYSENGAADSTNAQQAGIIVTGATVSSTLITGDVYDYSLFKIINYSSIQVASSTAFKGGANGNVIGGGMWASTTAISSMSIWNVANGVFPAGSWIKVWGY